MASTKTTLTELGTAVGLVYDPAIGFPDALDRATIPGLDADRWRAPVMAAARAGGADRQLLLRAIDNGRAFRQVVLRGRSPEHVAWTGGSRTTWTSDIPRDLTVDGVWFLQAKFDSTCVLNTSPAAMVDALLADDGVGPRRSWYEEVALDELQAYYRLVRQRAATARHGALDGLDDALPLDARDLEADHRRTLKAVLRSAAPSPAEDAAYLRLAKAVSIETALRWEHRLRASSPSQRTQMVFRMLRIAGGPYWVLGTKGAAPVRLAVTDTRSWRDRFELRRFDVTPGRAGQPQVDWRAEVLERATGDRRHVEGICEIRWSHGKLAGNPECKVQVATPLHELPGYDPMGT
jgi:hypothetical protein